MSAVDLITEHLDIWTTAQEQKAKGRGKSANNQSIYGIKKLRELILELAVQGKLVQQESNDEPASALLEKIQLERDQIIKEGKFKTLEEASPLDSTSLFPIPKSWSWVQLNDLAAIARGGSPRPIKSFLTDSPDGLNWIKIGDTDRKHRFIESTAEKIRQEGLAKSRMVYPGDLVLSNSMSYGFPYISRIEGCIHDGWLVIRTPKNLLDKMYLCYLFLSPHAKKSFDSVASGAVVQNLNADKVRKLTVALPPLAEQHRIVAKVDELMALCDQLEQQQTNSNATHQTLVKTLLAALTHPTTGVNATEPNAIGLFFQHFDTLFTTEQSIDQLKQTILQLAVMGKLVPQDPNDEPAIILLGRITEKRSRMVRAGKFKVTRTPLEIHSEEQVTDLPKNWIWTKLGIIAQINPRNITDDDQLVSFIPMADISTSHTGEHGQDQRYWNEIKAGYTHFANGDIGLAKITPCFENSKAVVFSQLRNGLGAGTTELHIARPFGSTLNARYILLYLKSPHFLHVGRSKMTGTAGQKRVPKEFFAGNPLPLPPLAEQNRIVAKVDELMAHCDALKAHLIEVQTTQLQLAYAIVDQTVA